MSQGTGGRGGVPRWVADRSGFPDIVSGQFERSMTCLVEEPFDKLLRYKEAMKRVATMIISRATADECVSPASKLFWIAAARSAVRARSGMRLARALERFPELGICSTVMVVLSLTLLVFTLWCALLIGKI